jgi:dihydropyrimidinase
MMFDLVIHGGTLVTAEHVFKADIGISYGKIAAIGANLTGWESVSAEGMLVIPGGIDPHVHLEMPTSTTVTSDDWASGTRAAAFGGTTTVVDFVEPEAGQSLLEALEKRRAQAQNGAEVDYALHMTLTNADPATLAQIPAVMAAGVTSFKVYTTYAGFALADKELLAIFDAVGAAGGLVMVHAENEAILQYSLARLCAVGQVTPQYYPLSRPAIAEVEAIQRVILLARFTDVPLYIVHISTARGSAAVERARQHGQVVYGETCPQYLLLDESLYLDSDPCNGLKYICAPPLRQIKDQKALWSRLQNNSIQTVGTDHCSFNLRGQKDLGLDSFLHCPGGLPGIEARLALLYAFGVLAGRLTLQQWVSCCTTAPAKIFGLVHCKGSLAVGADADIVLFDPNCKVTLTRSDKVRQSILHENVDHTPYEGYELKGWPVATYLRGCLIAHSSQNIDAAKSGNFIHCRSLVC